MHQRRRRRPAHRSELGLLGIAVLRFDFTGLGSSEGEFQNTNFSSNVEDLVRAADHLRTTLSAPAILIGHSLGGAAVLAAAHRVPEAKAVVTIGAPSDVAHVLRHFHAQLEDIERDGVATVTLAGRTLPDQQRAGGGCQGSGAEDRIANLRKALLVMHAPLDQTVGIEHATAIFTAAKHPKSFVSLDSADHLLSDSRMPPMPQRSLRPGRRAILPQQSGRATRSPRRRRGGGNGRRKIPEHHHRRPPSPAWPTSP